MADIFLTAASLGVRMYKGDSFSQNFEANWDLSQTTITAELRKDGKKVDDFVITAPVESQETPGTYLFTATLEDTDISGYYKWYFVFEGDAVRTNINGEFIISDRDDTKQSKKTTEVGQTLTKLNLQEATETISIVAAQGEGPKGQPGQEGKSAYQIWLDAGNTGTEQDFLDSLQGTDGDPAPEPGFRTVESGPVVGDSFIESENITDASFRTTFEKATAGPQVLQWRQTPQDDWVTLTQIPTNADTTLYEYEAYTGALTPLNDLSQIKDETLAAFGTDVSQLTIPGNAGDVINYNILVRDEYGNEAIYTAEVVTLLDPQVLGITVTPDPIEIDKDEVLTLGVTVNVQDGAGQGFTLSISDNSIASISGADITGLIAGSGIVTVTSDYDPSFSIDVSIVVSSDAPAVPTFLPAGFSNTIDSITVDWADVPEADTFEGVLEDLQGSPVQTFSGITATSRLFQGLDSGAEFKIKVRSSGPGGISAYAEENVQTDGSVLIETTNTGYFTP